MKGERTAETVVVGVILAVCITASLVAAVYQQSKLARDRELSERRTAACHVTCRTVDVQVGPDGRCGCVTWVQPLPEVP